jgi:hypothetical protein
MRLYNALGEQIWEKLDVPGVSGSDSVSVPYEGPALQSGMIYQFRALSIGNGDTAPPPISATEDLRGVFIYK